MTLQRSSNPVPMGPEAQSDDAGFTEEELTSLALAADPDRPLGPDAVPMNVFLSQLPGPLPDWYMPAAATRALGWRWPVVIAVVGALLLIASFGLCATYGQLGLA